MQNLRFDELKSIIVTREENGLIEKENISLKQFIKSFVKEKWKGERRYNSQYTIFGYFHTKTTIRNPAGDIVRRFFDFPSSDSEAERRHLENN